MDWQKWLQYTRNDKIKNITISTTPGRQCGKTVLVCIDEAAPISEEAWQHLKAGCLRVQKMMLDSGHTLPRTRAEFEYVFPEARKK